MKTVKVRIPVVLAGDGNYSVAGGSMAAKSNDWDWFFMEEDLECSCQSYSPYTRHIITAEIPLPETTEIEGTVEEIIAENSEKSQ